MKDGANKPVNGSIARMKALIDNGWLSVLKPTELNVYLTYNTKFADNITGEAFPSQSTIARILKTDERNIQKARRALVGYGLFQILDARGGYNKEGSLIQVCMPWIAPAPPVKSTPGETDRGLNQPLVNFTPTPGEFYPAPPVNFSILPPVDFTDQTPKRTPQELLKELPSGFERFWIAYPACERKTDKAKCLKFWKTHKLETAADEIIAGLEQWKLTRQWSDPRFVPLVMTWLNGRRWEEPPATQKGDSNGSDGHRKPAHTGIEENLQLA